MCNYFLKTKLEFNKSESQVFSASHLCSIARGISLFAYTLSVDIQKKLALKLEEYAFILLPHAPIRICVDFLQYMSRIYSGGRALMWKFIDQQLIIRFDELSFTDLRRIEYASRDKKLDKFYISESTIQRVKIALESVTVPPSYA